MSWVCWGGATYRPVGIFYQVWDRRGKMVNTPGKHWRGENSPQGKAKDKAAKEKEDVSEV